MSIIATAAIALLGKSLHSSYQRWKATPDPILRREVEGAVYHQGKLKRTGDFFVFDQAILFGNDPGGDAEFVGVVRELMSDIQDAAHFSKRGMGDCLKITTKAGGEYIFSLGSKKTAEYEAKECARLIMKEIAG
ncbi:MAG: hypothetical protein LBJ11_01540 [Oscillospiraceae bacterium]|jgi:hypothetical protein|nr:hypothetical protein [Oscillospiraceae bacterium]